MNFQFARPLSRWRRTGAILGYSEDLVTPGKVVDRENDQERGSVAAKQWTRCDVQPKRPHHLDAEMAIDYASSIAKRLRLEPLGNSNFEPAPPRLLQKYIAYARQYVFPRMSEEACQVIQNFYLRLRERRQSGDSTPITLRQLESLVRLAEARARIELREVVTKQDAVDVVEIMKESLLDKYVDEQGCVEVGRSGGMSKQKEAKRFLSALQNQSDAQQKAIFSTSELYCLADEIGLKVPDLDMFIDNLNQAGYLLKKGARLYQVQSSSYAGLQRGMTGTARPTGRGSGSGNSYIHP
ncbi:hypothetical protein CBR_g21769 [Chara braunii]|uniref:DNA helicase n=1 Tax=Chara braunii TaxID=69332 RepID=A0A388L1C4_CHABU|nr:hypothetical protein CBR_g21769 [Chara braunii]|eukprot:GBG76110.1 hypothetical protein CBR_g21769 [Chara braunii]